MILADKEYTKTFYEFIKKLYTDFPSYQERIEKTLYNLCILYSEDEEIPEFINNLFDLIEMYIINIL